MRKSINPEQSVLNSCLNMWRNMGEHPAGGGRAAEEEKWRLEHSCRS